MNRRDACRVIGSSALFPLVGRAAESDFQLRYTLSSALFGDMPISDVVSQASEAGCESVDIWRKVHATHREQIEEKGDEFFQELLAKHGTKLAVSTCYPLGPFRQDDELRWVKKNGGVMTVCGSGKMGDSDPVGPEAKQQTEAFFEKLKPHYELAEELGVTMAIENHKNSMLSSPDSIRYFAELNPSKNVGVAFAPHHLHDAVEEIPKLIRDIGKGNLPFVYFQEYHPSSKEQMAKEEELRQLPGFGTLDYVPILSALRDVGFDGLAEIFMHPVPRGIPILETPEEITAAVNKSRAYIDECLAKI